MAEVLFRAELERENLGEKFATDSFGLAAGSGEPASQNAQKAVSELGGSLANHRSRCAGDVALTRSDIFIGMTPGHLHALKTLPAQVFCIGEFFPTDAPCREVPDPFGGTLADYRNARNAITSAFPQLIQFLKTLA